MKTGLPDAVRSANARLVPSERSIAKAGGISPTCVPTGAAGASAATGTGVWVSSGGGGGGGRAPVFGGGGAIVLVGAGA